MNKRLIISIISFLAIYFPLNFCNDVAINFSKTKLNGNGIVEALGKYYKDKAEYPCTLDGLVPDYLIEIPDVTNKWWLPLIRREFVYNLRDYIPYHGSFKIEYYSKEDTKRYMYDSRDEKTHWNGVRFSDPDRMDVSIDREDIKIIIQGVEAYFADNSRYPGQIEELMPIYFDSFPFDLKAQYRPFPGRPNANSNLFKYTMNQPSDSFRGKYNFWFKVTYGECINLDSKKWYYNQHNKGVFYLFLKIFLAPRKG